MIDGHSIGASAQPSALARALSRAAGGWGGCQAWHRLDPDRRLQLVEQAMRPTDGLVDEYSLAL